MEEVRQYIAVWYDADDKQHWAFQRDLLSAAKCVEENHKSKNRVGAYGNTIKVGSQHQFEWYK
jgi:hypothetical protein